MAARRPQLDTGSLRWAVRRADGPRARARGLLGRRTLGRYEGLWMRARSVHTFGMRMALDLVWLDGAGRPIRTDRDVRPGRVRTCAAARGGVVEVAAGRGASLAAELRGADRGAGRPRGAAPGVS